jgi:hypothetical protein
VSEYHYPSSLPEYIQRRAGRDVNGRAWAESLNESFNPDWLRLFLDSKDGSRLLHLKDADVQQRLGVTRMQFLNLIPEFTEDDFTELVMGMAMAAGLLVHHCGAARLCKGGRGLPDLVLAGGSAVLFAELKRWVGGPSHPQDNWRARLEQIGGNVRYAFWRPQDLPRIGPALRALAENRPAA